VKPESDLGRHLCGFLGDFMPKQRRSSPQTVRAYRDALKLLLCRTAELCGCSVGELRLEQVDRPAVLGFLESIEAERGNGISTRNHRLAAIRSFFRYVSASAPDAVEQCAQILTIPLKRGDTRTVDYLTTDEIQGLLQEVPTNTVEGRRDDALLRFMYNTGARVQETLDTCTTDVQLDTPAHVLLRGKGRKERVCPLWPDTVSRLRRVLVDLNLDPRQPSRAPIFTNRGGRALSRFGVGYILAKYARAAAVRCPSLARKRVHPHTLRHTTAMHLLQSGVDINTIRCWLGHASVTTTNHYVEIDLEMKRRALDAVRPPTTKGRREPSNTRLLSWLESL